jgi:hypothetical protein
VLRDGVRVAPAALERAAERHRVHARGVSHEIDRAREVLRRADVGEPQPHLIVHARRRARLHAAEHLLRDARHVRARAVDEPARAGDVDLHASALAQQRAGARDRRLLAARTRRSRGARCRSRRPRSRRRAG